MNKKILKKNEDKINTNHIYIFSRRNRNSLYEVQGRSDCSSLSHFSSSFRSQILFIFSSSCSTLTNRTSLIRGHHGAQFSSESPVRSRNIVYPQDVILNQLYRRFKVLIIFALIFSPVTAPRSPQITDSCEFGMVSGNGTRLIHDEIYKLCCLNDVFTFQQIIIT